MRGQHARAAGRTGRSCDAHPGEHAAERRRIACDRSRAERGDAESRHPLGQGRDRAAAVQRVRALEAMYVNVYKTRDDVVAGKWEVERLRIAPAAGGDLGDPVPLEHERASAEHSIREHQIRARQEDHADGRASRAAPIATSSAPSVENSTRRSFIASGGSRRAHSWRTGSSMRSATATLPLTMMTSGSIAAASVATAIPMYFAVSRITEIATPSPPRAPSKTC